MKDTYATKSLKRITQFLDRADFDGFTTEDLFIKQFVPKGWGQDIAALSNMAEAIRNLYRRGELTQTNAARYMAKVHEYAASPSVRPWKKPISIDTHLGGHGYYLEHLNIHLVVMKVLLIMLLLVQLEIYFMRVCQIVQQPENYK